MALALTCPLCDERPVETIRNTGFIQGFLIMEANAAEDEEAAAERVEELSWAYHTLLG